MVKHNKGFWAQCTDLSQVDSQGTNILLLDLIDMFTHLQSNSKIVLFKSVIEQTPAPRVQIQVSH